MLNKYSLILSMLCAVLITQSTAAHHCHKKSSFNPEEVHFSKISTLKSWVAKKYYIDENKENTGFLKLIQYLAAKTLRQNPQAHNFVFPIQNDLETKQNYGNSLLTIPKIELPFLQFAHTISKNKKLKVLMLTL